MRRFLARILTFTLLAVSAPALAEDREKAQEEMQVGGEALDSGRYAEALRHFKLASEYAPSASGPHREMGKAYEGLGRYEDAKREYEIYLEMKPGDATVRALLAEVEKKLAAQPRDEEDPTAAPSGAAGALSLSVNVSGAKISIDGKSVGKSPLKKPPKLSVGTHILTIEKRGFRSITKEIEITDEPLELSETLEPVSGKSEDSSEDSGGSRRGLALTLLSVGGAGVAGGITSGFLALDAKKDIEALVEDNQPVEFLDFQEIQRRGIIFNVLTVTGYTLGAAGVGSGLWILYKDKKEGESSASLEIYPTPGGAAATIRF